jgi:predicted esterase
LLAAAGLAVRYMESDVGHTIDPAHLEAAREWVAETLEGVEG